MSFCLAMHGMLLDWPAQEIGDLIIALAQHRIDDAALADWLRGRV